MSMDGRFLTDDINRLDVLVVENDPATARLTMEAFREAGLHHGVVWLTDGEGGLCVIRREGKHHTRPHPDLIFLDLHMPKKSGLQVLAEIKNSHRLVVIPVIVVSGSEDPSEVRKAYELHASCYIRKPSDLHQFLQFISVCYQFWGGVVTLPPKAELTSSMA